jgi:hypothetical protein
VINAVAKSQQAGVGWAWDEKAGKSSCSNKKIHNIYILYVYTRIFYNIHMYYVYIYILPMRDFPFVTRIHPVLPFLTGRCTLW